MTEVNALLDAFRVTGRALTNAGLAPLGQGALSVWTPDALVITREGAMLDLLEAVDLALISRATIPPAATPALDTPIHRAIYVMSGAGAIVHAHPPHAIALSMQGQTYTPDDHEGRHELGMVPIVSARRNIVDAVATAMERAPIVLVAGHGSYARGANLREGLRWTAILEASARLTWLRATLATGSPLAQNGATAPFPR